MKKLLVVLLSICILTTACGTEPEKERDSVNFLTNMAETPEPTEEPSLTSEPEDLSNEVETSESGSIEDSEPIESDSPTEASPEEVVIDPAEQYAMEMAKVQGWQEHGAQTAVFVLYIPGSSVVLEIEPCINEIADIFTFDLEADEYTEEGDGTVHAKYHLDEQYVEITKSVGGVVEIYFTQRQNDLNAPYMHIRTEGDKLKELYVEVAEGATEPYSYMLRVNGCGLDTGLDEMLYQYGTPYDVNISKIESSGMYQISYYWSSVTSETVRADFLVVSDSENEYRLSMRGMYIDG